MKANFKGTAKYEGLCPKCGTAIHKGDTINFENERWCHFGCTQNGLPKHEYDSSEYAKGRANAQRFRENAAMFGEEAAYAEEMAWEAKDPDPAY